MQTWQYLTQYEQKFSSLIRLRRTVCLNCYDYCTKAPNSQHKQYHLQVQESFVLKLTFGGTCFRLFDDGARMF